MRIEIWHNKNERDSFFRGFDSTDPMDLVYEGEIVEWGSDGNTILLQKGDLTHHAGDPSFHHAGDPSFERLSDDPEDVCEYVFMANQHVSASHQPWYKGARSLSKGDVIVIDDRAFAVESVGFKEVSWTQ